MGRRASFLVLRPKEQCRQGCSLMERLLLSPGPGSQVGGGLGVEKVRVTEAEWGDMSARLMRQGVSAEVLWKGPRLDPLRRH